MGTEEVVVGFEDVVVGFEDVVVGFEDVVVGFEDVVVGFEDVVVGFEDVVVGEGELFGTKVVQSESGPNPTLFVTRSNIIWLPFAFFFFD